MISRFPPEGWGQTGEESINALERYLKSMVSAVLNAPISTVDWSEAARHAMISRSAPLGGPDGAGT